MPDFNKLPYSLRSQGDYFLEHERRIPLALVTYQAFNYYFFLFLHFEHQHQCYSQIECKWRVSITFSVFVVDFCLKSSFVWLFTGFTLHPLCRLICMLVFVIEVLLITVLDWSFYTVGIWITQWCGIQGCELHTSMFMLFYLDLLLNCVKKTLLWKLLRKLLHHLPKITLQSTQ